MVRPRGLSAITAPTANATSVAIASKVATAAFSMQGRGVHDASRYQGLTTASFATVARDGG